MVFTSNPATYQSIEPPTNEMKESVEVKTTPFIASQLEPFSFIRETFGQYNQISENVNEKTNKLYQDRLMPIQLSVNDYANKIKGLNHQIIDLSNNIVNYKNDIQMINPNQTINLYNDFVKTPFLFSPPTLQDGLIEDGNIVELHENTAYIAGVVAISTLFIGAIMVANR